MKTSGSNSINDKELIEAAKENYKSLPPNLSKINTTEKKKFSDSPLLDSVESSPGVNDLNKKDMIDDTLNRVEQFTNKLDFISQSKTKTNNSSHTNKLIHEKYGNECDETPTHSVLTDAISKKYTDLSKDSNTKIIINNNLKKMGNVRTPKDEQYSIRHGGLNAAVSENKNFKEKRPVLDLPLPKFEHSFETTTDLINNQKFSNAGDKKCTKNKKLIPINSCSTDLKNLNGSDTKSPKPLNCRINTSKMSSLDPRLYHSAYFGIRNIRKSDQITQKCSSLNEKKKTSDSRIVNISKQNQNTTCLKRNLIYIKVRKKTKNPN